MKVYLNNSYMLCSNNFIEPSIFEVGYIATDGTQGGGTEVIRSKYYIEVPNGVGTVLCTFDANLLELPAGTHVNLNVHEYDSSKNSVRRNGYKEIGVNIPYVLKSETKYIRITMTITNMIISEYLSIINSNLSKMLIIKTIE